MRTRIISLCLALGIAATSWAQKQTVTGSVVDADGEPVIGAVVKTQDGKVAGVTDVNGAFTLSVPQGKTTLVISSVGLKTQMVSVTAGKPLSVKMANDEKTLDELVVVGYGIQKKSALTGSIETIKAEDLTMQPVMNLDQALTGQVAGLQVMQASGDPSTAREANIRVRGINDAPLLVIDGVPRFGTTTSDGEMRLSDLNPDDIENISVLKGPAASALYGSRASHGVILITTKKADAKKDFSVELNSTTTIEKQLTKWDDVQYEFGQGADGKISLTDDRFSSNRNWGPRIDPGLMMTYFDGVARPYVIIKDNIDGFFRTGVNTTNSLIVNKKAGKTGVRITYTDMRDKDLIPKTHMARNTLNLRTNTTITKFLDLDFKVTYTHEGVKNRPAVADHRANIAKNLMTLSTTFDQAWLKEHYEDENGEYYNWNDGDVYNINPYWVLHKMTNRSWKDNYKGSAVIRYRPLKQLTLQATAGTDINYFTFEEFAYPTSPGRERGMLSTKDYKNRMYTAELLAIYKGKFKKWDYGATLGGSLYKTDNKTQIVTAQNMIMRDAKTLQSFTEKTIREEIYRRQINSLYGSMNFAYDNFAFLDMTLRGDCSSTLPVNNNVYWYPSVSGSLLFSELLHVDKNILPYGKVRASWAKVGNDTSPYMLRPTYEMALNSFGQYPMASISGDVIPNKNLKPTMTNSIELGFELKFLKNRLGLDFTYYNQNSKDQILRMNTSYASGYRYQLINAGDIENRGVEVVLNTRPIEMKDFSWDLNVNFAKNSNKVKELANGVDEFELASARWLGVKVVAKVGENYGCIMGKDFLRNDNGDIIIDGKTGLPKMTHDLKVLGNATWDWTGGLTTNVRYKNLSLGAIFDVKVGADLYSMSARSAYSTGKHKETLEGRDAWYESEEKRLAAGVTSKDWHPTGGYVAKGVIEQPDGTFKPNDIFVSPQEYWTYVTTQTARPFIYDNTYVKLREFTLSYAFPRRMLGKVVNALSVSFVARNLFNLYKNVPNIDPDSNYNNSTGMGLEFGSLPSRRSFGLNVNLKF